MNPNKRVFQKRLIASMVASTALAGFSGMAHAQSDEPMLEEVVVTGIRGSLERAMDIKRDSSGVVDAISAEDIGKFPDTNLAESLQRITGVSIDRVNGEGSTVTVRGFGGDNNLVTLNGRQMPASNSSIIGADQSGDFAQPLSRSFDFSTLASEGVNRLEVYKTGRASIPSGGLGATIDIGTHKPLDNPGTQFSLGGKLVNDSSVVDGDEITPEVSGLFSWTNDDDNIGFSIFASHQVRHAASVSATSNGWNIMPYSQFSDPGTGIVTEDTVIANAPANPDQLVSVPNDTRLHLAEAERERTNVHGTFQFKPMEELTLTFDAFLAQNEQEEQRADKTMWFARPLSHVRFDGDPTVSTTTYMREEINGVKDVGFEQQYRAMEDTVESYGFNAEWDMSDDITLTLDAHSSENTTSPNNPNGASSTLFGMGAVIIGEHSLNLDRNPTHFPIQKIIEIDDSVQADQGDFGGTNNNGVLDVGDLGSQVLRSNTAEQTTTMDQVQLSANWELNDNLALDFGVDHRVMEMNQTRVQTQHILGGWGIEQPGDINTDLVTTYCLTCLFEDFQTYAGENEQTAFKGDATALANSIPEQYGTADVTGRENNFVEEEISAVYAEADMEFQVAGFDTSVLAGLRYEETTVTSTSFVTLPDEIMWVSDNDFQAVVRGGGEPLPDTIIGEYDNVLPSLDVSVNLTEDFVARASVSQTIGRPGYGNLIAARNVQNPGRPTALGGDRPSAGQGNPGLDPLESRNLDLSLEYYYGNSSYVSAGYYEKKIENFIGTAVTDVVADGPDSELGIALRDPSAGAPGSRSGDALDVLDDLGVTRSEGNFFTMTALIEQNGGDVAAARTEFEANLDENNELPLAYVEEVYAETNLSADENDPYMEFALSQPVNTREGRIHGMELAAQHFFGDSGFGLQVNYTTVNGNVGIDPGATPDEDQFALVGLSDSANASLIYENYGVSARLAWNWRDTYLSGTGRGGANRNPTFVDAYHQYDLNVGYDVTDNLSVTFEAINLTGENIVHYGRTPANIWFLQELSPRYMLGARYSF
ncbi:TonB-dependent receptor [Marinimicrobium sp. C2-29]|uniref:TonB-dependent receptor n=1 Tax=Marinimicrobium sp. C2-29 TaxID=3139825 RepID=UPI0031399909